MSSRQYLIADPDAGQRQLLDLLLADGETTIAAFENARQTLEFLRSNTPALVVLAYELPDMPGIEVCQRIKLVGRLQQVPVIVTVEPGDFLGVPDEIRDEAYEAGVDLLLPKPLGDKAIRERANRLIQSGGEGRQAAHMRPRKDTGVIEASLKELEDRQRVTGPSAPAAADVENETTAAGRSAKADESLKQELERLREENAKLRRRLVGQMETAEKLQAELEELRQRSKRGGIFGRRREG